MGLNKNDRQHRDALPTILAAVRYSLLYTSKHHGDLRCTSQGCAHSVATSIDTSLNGYAETFEKALKKKTQFANFNKDMNHAAIIVCMAFRHAENNIRLLTHKLDESLYGSKWFLDELERFIGKQDSCLKILIESDIVEDHPVMQMSAQHNQIEVKRVPDVDVREYPFNFMLVDDVGYRFERDRNSHEATVVFNYDDDLRFKELRESCDNWFNARWESIDTKIA